MSKLPPEYLRASVRKPMSPYEEKAGTIIPAVMLTAISSDLPGQITCQVRENVYDIDTGEHLLIPQGTRLVGLYDPPRCVRPAARPDHVEAPPPAGRIEPELERRHARDGRGRCRRLPRSGEQPLPPGVFGNALLLSVIGADVQLEPDPEFGQNFRGPTAGNVLGAAVGQQFGSTASEFIRRGMSLAPTLDVRPGFPFNVMVTQDVIFPGPYQEATSR